MLDLSMFSVLSAFCVQYSKSYIKAKALALTMAFQLLSEHILQFLFWQFSILLELSSYGSIP